MKKVLLINGPNLGILGVRQPEIYGSQTLSEIVEGVRSCAAQQDCALLDRQSNSEGELISFLNQEFKNFIETRGGQKSPRLGLIVNLGAYSHTSIALRDALEPFYAERVPIFEVHLSNIFAREPFRHHSLMSPVATGVICGLGGFGYEVALHSIFKRWSAVSCEKK